MANEIPFVGQSYHLNSVDVSAQRCVNMYPEVQEDKSAKVVVCLKLTPGLLQWADQNFSDAYFNRGLYLASDGRFFSVCGTTLNNLSTDGTVGLSWSLAGQGSDYSIAHFADNGTNMLVTTGDSNPSNFDAIVNLDTNVRTYVTDTDYPKGRFCAILDGYFIVNKPGTIFAYYSALDDPSDWSSLRSISKEANTDNVTALIAHNGRLLLIGNQSHEWFYNTGDSASQFLRMQGTAKNIGIQAPDSLAENGTSVFWLASNASGYGQIYMTTDFFPVPISTVPIEQDIHSYAVTSDAEGFCYQQEGQEFYQLNFPTAGKSWVFDTKSGMWHERSHRNPTTSAEGVHLARVQGAFNGKNYVGERNSQLIHELSTTTYTDNGDTILRTRSSPHVWRSLERIYYSSIQFDVSSGVGLGSGQGSDPKLRLRWSNDGGHTWSNHYQLNVGKIGKYSTRVKKNRLGASRDRVFELTYSEPTDLTILSAFVEVE